MQNGQAKQGHEFIISLPALPLMRGREEASTEAQNLTILQRFRKKLCPFCLPYQYLVVSLQAEWRPKCPSQDLFAQLFRRTATSKGIYRAKLYTVEAVLYVQTSP